jgi:transcriptional regulator with XRE-family HTH domain
MLTGADRERLKEFGENLKKIRTRKGYSLRALSHECRIDFSDIGKMERGETNPTLLTILELAKALQVSADELVRF